MNRPHRAWLFGLLAPALAACGGDTHASGPYHEPLEGAFVQRIVDQGGLLEQSFTFVNTTDRVLEAPEVHVSCSCIHNEFEPERLAPGETGRATFVRAHPAAGTERSSAWLRWEDGTITLLEWQITALRPDSVQVWPDQVDRRVMALRGELPFVFLADLDAPAGAPAAEVLGLPAALGATVVLDDVRLDPLGVTQGRGRLVFERDAEALAHVSSFDLDLGHERLVRIHVH